MSLLNNADRIGDGDVDFIYKALPLKLQSRKQILLSF